MLVLALVLWLASCVCIGWSEASSNDNTAMLLAIAGLLLASIGVVVMM